MAALRAITRAAAMTMTLAPARGLVRRWAGERDGCACGWQGGGGWEGEGIRTQSRSIFPVCGKSAPRAVSPCPAAFESAEHRCTVARVR
ncbi:hypothetical protein T492DRAFT_472024 [Pavlovales sp. CCMP2436]|nr:hypothetical protein T492DRAFT_472024 [Pavlovales sp. CCMP2436]